MTIQILLDVISKLRGPEGCPWDKEQTHESLAPYAVEEAIELQNAIYSGNTDEIIDELGDVLMQVVLHAQLLKEQALGDFSTVAEHLSAKLVRRHPHVFGDEKADSVEDVVHLYENLKSKERQGKTFHVKSGLPALRRAHKLGEAAQKLQFDWPTSEQVWAKVQEELSELQGADEASAAEELGDLLFSLGQWARHKGLDAEAELQKANSKFERRFQAAQAKAQQRGWDWEAISPRDREALWQEVKLDERS